MTGELIETAFQNMCKRHKTPKLDLYYVYKAAKSRLETCYYPYIIHRQPFMTDHGPGHIRRILEKLSGLLAYHIPLPRTMVPEERLVNISELYILLNSVIWHDIGNLYGREDHAQSIHRIFDQVKNFLYDDYEIEWIAKTAKAHSGKDAIESNIEVEVTYVHDLPIYPRFLAALLRLADEIEEDSRRIGEKIYEDIPEAKRAYWFFCKCNQSMRVVADLEGCSLAIDCKMQKDEVWRQLGKDIGENQIININGVEEYINRLQKINEERIYCNQFLERSHYYRPIRWLDLNLKIYDGDSIAYNIDYRFISNNDFQQFFTDYANELEICR